MSPTTQEAQPYSLVLSNNGATELSIFNIVWPEGYTLDGWSGAASIAPGLSQDYTLTCSGEAGLYEGDLVIVYDDGVGESELPFIVSLRCEIPAPASDTSAEETATPAAPEVEVSLDTVLIESGAPADFGSHKQGSAQPVALTVTNAGTADLVVSDIVWPEGYTLDGWSGAVSIAPGLWQDYTLTCSGNVGSYAGDLSIVSSDGDEPLFMIPLSCEVQAPTPSPDTSSDETDVSGVQEALPGMGLPAVEAPTAPELDVSLNTVLIESGAPADFGSHKQGSAQPMTLTIANAGTADLVVSDIVWPEGYTLDGWSGAVSIAPGLWQDYTLTCSGDVGSYAGDLTIVSSDDDETFLISLACEIVGSPELSVLVDGAEIQTAASVSLGNRPSDTLPQAVVVEVRNGGSAPLSLTASFSDLSAFSVEGAFPSTLNQGEFAQIKVQCDTTQVGTYSFDATLTSNDDDEGTFAFTGLCTITPPPDSDSDGVPNAVDNCLMTSNPDQSDVNFNGTGDACEIPDTETQGTDGVIFLVEPAIIEQGGQARLTNYTPGSLPVVSWMLNGEVLLDTDTGLPLTGQSVTVTGAEAGSLPITLTLQDGAATRTGQGTLTVLPVPEQPVVELRPDVVTGQPPLKVNFEVVLENADPAAVCQVQTGDGGFSTSCADFVYTYALAGTYEAKITVYSGRSVVTDRVVIAPFVTQEPPQAVIRWDLDVNNLLLLNSVDSEGFYDTVLWTIKGLGNTPYLKIFDTFAPEVTLVPGTYLITLRVEGLEDAYNQTSVSIVIPEQPETTAGFSLSTDECHAPCDVTALMTTTGEIWTVEMDWGDGGLPTTNIDTQAVHTFNTPGVYLITQYVYSPDGIKIARQAITILDPVLSFGCSVSPGAEPGDPVLIHMHSLYGSPTLTSITWDFGEASFTTDGTPREYSYAYVASGTHTASVAAEDDRGLSGTATCTTDDDGSDDDEVHVIVAPDGYLWFEVISQAAVPAPTPIEIQPHKNGAIKVETLEIDWGDGSDPTTNLTTLNDPLPHTYETAGEFTITLSGRAGNDEPRSFQKTVTIYPDVTAVITASSLDCVRPCREVLSAADSQGGVRYEWVVQTPSLSRRGTGITFNPILNESGPHTISLTVYGAPGNPDEPATASIQVAVTDPVAAQVKVHAIPRGGFAPLPVCLKAEPSGTYTDITWDAKNGQPISTEAEFCTDYPVPGIYRPEVNVLGVVASAQANIPVYVFDPDAEIDITQTLSFDGTKVCFATADGVTNVYWIFEDNDLNSAPPYGVQWCVLIADVEGNPVIVTDVLDGVPTAGGVILYEPPVITPVPTATGTATPTPDGSATVTVTTTPEGSATASATAATASPSRTPFATVVPASEILYGRGAVTSDELQDDDLLQEMLPRRLYEEVYDPPVHPVDYIVPVGVTNIYQVAAASAEICDSAAISWFKIYYDNYYDALDLTNYGNLTSIHYDGLASFGMVRQDNDTDDLIEPNQRVTFTLKISVTSGGMHSVVISDTLAPGWAFTASTGYIDLDGPDGPLEPYHLSDPQIEKIPQTDQYRLTWDLDKLLDSDIEINLGVTTLSYKASAPTPFLLEPGTHLKIDCAAAAVDTTELYESPDTITDDAAICLSAQTFVRYIEWRANQEGEYYAAYQGYFTQVTAQVDAAIAAVQSQDTAIQQAIGKYQAAKANVDKSLSKSRDLLDDIKTFDAIIAANDGLIGSNTSSALDLIKQKRETALAAYQTAIAEAESSYQALLTESLNVLKVLQQTQNVSEELQYGLALYGGGRVSANGWGEDDLIGNGRVTANGWGEDNLTGDGRVSANGWGELLAELGALRQGGLTWLDSVCADSSTSTSVTSDLIDWSVYPREGYCAAYVFEVRLNNLVDYPNGYEGDPVDPEAPTSYKYDDCDPLAGGVCLPPVAAAYEWVTKDVFDPWRYQVGEEMLDLNSDIRQSGIQVGDAIVWERGSQGMDLWFGHTAVVSNVTKDYITVVGTSNDDGVPLTMRLSRGSLGDVYFMALTPIADFDFVTAGSDVTFTDISPAPYGSGVTAIPDPDIIKREWDFDGNGTVDNLTDISFKYTYPAPGTYTAQLKVTRSNGMVSIVNKTVTIVDICLGITDIPNPECLALVDLHRTTAGASWANSEGWLTAPTVCHVWYGITCTEVPDIRGKYHVLEINLPNNHLMGTLPGTLPNLAELRVFSVPNNLLSGSAANVEGLTRLEILRMSSNQFTELLPDITKLKYIKEIYLDRNIFVGGFFTADELKIATTPDLTRLDVSYNRLASILPSELKNRTWDLLRLDENLLTTSIIATGSGKPPAQQAIMNPTLDTALAAAAPGWLNTQTLPPLTMDVQTLSPTSIQATWSKPVYQNSYGGLIVTCDVIAPLQDKGFFTGVAIGGGRVTANGWGGDVLGEGRVTASGWGGDFVGGGRVTANGWGTDGEGNVYPLESDTAIHFTTTDLSVTTHTFEHLAPETQWYCGARTYTRAHGDQKSTLVSYYGYIASTITGPFCTDARMTQIPPKECKSLVAQYKALKGSSWTIPTPWFETFEVCSWAGLSCTPVLSDDYRHIETITLAGRGLSGQIPVEIKDLVALKDWNIANNKVIGTLPALGALKALQTFNAADNQFSGGIANQVSGAASLKTIILRNNKLDGVLATTLFTLPALEVVDLANNSLQGKLPELSASEFKAVKLTALRLDRNMLTGVLPTWLQYTPNLAELDIANNGFSGSVPAWLKTAAVTDLDITYNMLTTPEASLTAWLNGLNASWAQTQTIAPTGLSIAIVDSTTATLSWQPIPYQADGGYYEIWCGTDGNYTRLAVTASKAVGSTNLLGLQSGQIYTCRINTWTLKHGEQKNQLVSPYSQTVSFAMPLPLQNPIFITGRDTYTSDSSHNPANGYRRFVVAGTYTDYTTGGSYTTWDAHGYLYFDLSSLPATASIKGATLVLYHYGTGSNQQSLRIERVTSPWAETIIFGQEPGRTGNYGSFTVPYYNARAYIGEIPRRVEIPLTPALIKDLMANPNHGIALISDNPVFGSGIAFCSSNSDGFCPADMAPRLALDITTAPPVGNTAANLLANASFDEGKLAWTANGSGSVDFSVIGQASLERETAAGTANLYQEVNYSVLSGTTLQFLAQLENPNNTEKKVELTITNQDGTEQTRICTFTLAAHQPPQTVNLTDTVPQIWSNLRVIIRDVSPANSGAIILHKTSLSKGNGAVGCHQIPYAMNVTYLPAAPAMGDTITFTSDIKHTFSEIRWTFGTGASTKAVGKSAAYTYSSEGEKTITAEAVLEPYQDIVRKTITINVAPAAEPVADFTVIVKGMTVWLDPRGSTGLIDHVQWTLSPNVKQTATRDVLTYTYTNPGTYHVTLSVEGPGGSHEISHDVVVPNNDCVFNIAAGDVPALIAAINKANSNTCLYEDTITLASGTYNFSATSGSGDALPIITDALTLKGTGVTFARVGSSQFRFLSNTSKLTIEGITFKNGLVDGEGGAILNAGDLTMNNVEFIQNAATGNGGAVSSQKYAPILSTNGTFTNNKSGRRGGAVSLYGGLALPGFGNTFDGNTAAQGDANVAIFAN